MKLTDRREHGTLSYRNVKLLLRVFLILPLFVFSDAVSGGELGSREQARKERNAKYDTHNLRERDTFVVERTGDFLNYPGDPDGDFVIAEVPPTVKFQILPELKPEYFSGDVYQAGWANWAKVTRSDDNRFYFSASDHRSRGAQINLYEYRPDEDAVERVLDVGEALDWRDDMYTDGKIHGRKGIMPDGTLWAATHRGPMPTEEWYEAGYQGSWLFSYDINTGEHRNWGVPLERQELPLHKLDTRRGIFFATGGLDETMLVWDVNEKKVLFDGTPPENWAWHERSMLLDEETGHFWGMDKSEQPYRFMSFNPADNTFKRHDVEVPSNPVSNRQRPLRGHTDRPAKDGWYYWATWSGAFFRFRPDWDNGPQVELVGTTWDQGRDVLQLALCPAGRYIYYQPRRDPAPLVQYDVKTGQKKVIAYLQDYLVEKYGYWTSSHTYGMEVSNDGSFVVIIENGTFAGPGGSWGHPAITVINIPEQERPLD